MTKTGLILTYTGAMHVRGYSPPKVNQASSQKVHKDHAESDIVQALVWLDKNLGQNVEMIHTIHHCLRDLPPDYAIPTLIQLDESVKSHLISTKDDTIAYPAHNTAEHERRDILSALFLELNSRAFTQLDQYQLEAIIRNINSRLEWRARHPRSAQDTNIVDCLPFIRWPIACPIGDCLEVGGFFYMHTKFPLTQVIDLLTPVPSVHERTRLPGPNQRRYRPANMGSRSPGSILSLFGAEQLTT